MSAERIAGSVEVDGVQIPYIDAGREATGRPPLLLLHGEGGNAETHFAYLLSMLSFRQRVIALDFQAPRLGASGVDAFVNQVLGVADHVVPGRTIGLLGYGLGAVIAAVVAAKEPGRVDRLVLVAGWSRTDAHQRLRHDVWRSLQRLDRDSALRFAALTELSPGYIATWGPNLPIPDRQEEDLHWLQMEAADAVDITELAPLIRARTLLVAAASDQVVPKSHVKQLLGAIDDARYVEINSGHAIHVERPAELFQRVDDFMHSPSANPAGSLIAAAHP